MPTVVLYGDTIRHASLRHEVPLEILDPILIVLGDGPPRVLTSSLELSRIATAVPEAELATFNALGLFELIDAGRSREEAELETVLRALQEWGVREALVAPDFPVAVADHVRAAGIRLDVATDTVGARRRVKNEAELAGIRRAVRAAEQGLAAGERLIRAAAPEGELLHLGGAPLTADRVRAAIREACAAAGAPAPPDIIVTSVLEQGGGHDPGSGPLPAGLPICIDLWPRDEASGCWADMARTFINGPVPPRVAELVVVVREALEASRAAARPGISGRELYDIAADIIERAGQPTQRTREPGEVLDHGFYFALGHGVGLEVHEPPDLGLAGGDRLVAGDVIAIEPGVDGVEGIGSVGFEDMLLITEDGSETLTRYPYEL